MTSRRFALAVAAAFLAAPAAMMSADAAPATSRIVVALPRFGEGVAIDPQGRMWVSQPLDGLVLRFERDTPGDVGPPAVWLRATHPNGHKILADGSHVVATAGAVVRLDADGREIARWTRAPNGSPFLEPNDVAADPAGGFWFTDPGRFGKPDPGRVFRVDAGGKLSLAAAGIDFPNGIVVRGRQLLVGESRRGRILRFAIQADGRLGPQGVFAVMPPGTTHWTPSERPEPDGVALAADGTLYVAQFGTPFIRVFGPDGRLRDSIDTGAPSVTNLVLIGSDRLYATVATGDGPTGPGAIVELPRSLPDPATTTAPRSFQ